MAELEESAAEKLPVLRKSAQSAIKDGTAEGSDIDIFWLFLARVAPGEVKHGRRHLLEVIASAAEHDAWAERFWQLDDRLALWDLAEAAAASRPEVPELAVAAAAKLLARAPWATEGQRWLAEAPQDFQVAVLAAPELRPRPSEVSPGASWEDTPASAADLPPTTPTTFGRATDADADTDVSPSSESYKLLGGGEKKRGSLAAKKTLTRMRSRLSQYSVGRGRDSDPSDPDAPADGHLEAEAWRGEGEEGAPGARPAPNPAEPEAPGKAYAVAACAFEPDDARAVAPGDGVLVRVAKGERLEVLGHHPAGWIRVRSTEDEDGLEGWLPEGACEAVGEVGRRIAARAVKPPEGADDRQLHVREGALLKLLEREGDAWWVEVEGCRGYVPANAMRELRAGEEAGLLTLRPRLARALSSASAGQKGARRPAAGVPGTVRRALASGIATGKDAKEGEGKQSPWTFGLWAYMASFYAIFLAAMLGVAGIASSFRPADRYPRGMKSFAGMGRHLFTSAFCVACGALWFVFNLLSKRSAKTNYYTPRGTPVRGAIILVLAAPMLASGLTFLAGAATVFVALLAFISARRREQGSAPEGASAAVQFLTADEDLKGWSRLSPGFWLLWWELQGVRGERPKIFLVLVWLAANVLLGTYKYLATQASLTNPTPKLVELISTQCWTGDLREPGEEDCTLLLDLYQRWIPWAKFFGMTLNLNCALIVLMVCQRFISRLSDRASHTPGVLGMIFRRLPTHKSLIFHKGLAATIAVQAFIHTFAHYMAHSWTLPTLTRFGASGKWVTLSIWVTGAIIIMCIVAMYPVSREFVKKTKFEAFFYTHIVCAFTFMVCLLWHGPVFYLWAAGPLGLYVLDRYTRWQVSSLSPAKLLQVKFRPPVLQLTFDAPWRYYAGQYVWLCCPSIRNYEKHPFTIASAPETDLLCLAIKCWPGGWTEKLRDFLAGICEASGAASKGFTYTFEEPDWLTGQPLRGITEAPDGQPLLLIDGPHAAPAMRYLEFKVVILAAAGIGLTPASSVLRSLLQYRWRHSENARPHSIYFCWLCACAEVPAFEWFAEEISDSEVAATANEAVHGRRSDPPRACELHLFVTRAPPAGDPQALGPPEAKPAKIHGRLEKVVGAVDRPYTGAELMRWMRHPSTKSDEMEQVLSRPQGSRPNEAGHTCVWNGRPNWDALFAHVAQRHRAQGGKVGVFFCGAPAIGKDLRKNCNAHSDNDLHFMLMKESF